METQEQQDDFKHALTSFVRLYAFLSQIMPFGDMELEKLYTYSRFLLKKLPKTETDPFHLGDEVDLEFYRLQKMKESIIEMEDQTEYGLDGISDAGIRTSVDEKVLLSEIIEVLNDRFGTEFNEADKTVF